jgi:hypothetical protein
MLPLASLNLKYIRGQKYFTFENIGNHINTYETHALGVN